MRLKLKKGLDLPLKGAPAGNLQTFPQPSVVALNLEPFENLRFKLLVKVGDLVKMGQPLVENKNCPGQFFVSPAGGEICEIRRGLKRRLLDIVIKPSDTEAYLKLPPLTSPSQDQILKRLMEGGAFAYIHARPFNTIALPSKLPRDIFVSAVESAPFTPSAEMQIAGFEEDFYAGLDVLSKLTTGRVHLITRPGFNLPTPAIEKHVIEGPHPSAHSSVHIHHIAPIKSHNETVWTLTTIGVITIGRIVRQGEYHIHRIVGLGGEGVISGKEGYFKTRAGVALEGMLQARLKQMALMTISGDVLMGSRVELDAFLGFFHTTVSVIPLCTSRQSFHFLRPGFNKFTATRTYLSAFFKKKQFHFSTTQHGEERAFIDGSIYKKVMPMRIPCMQLIKAILAEDFELAERLGLLEIAPEDFSLATFICPSKIEMVDIVKRGLQLYAAQLGH